MCIINTFTLTPVFTFGTKDTNVYSRPYYKVHKNGATWSAVDTEFTFEQISGITVDTVPDATSLDLLSLFFREEESA